MKYNHETFVENLWNEYLNILFLYEHLEKCYSCLSLECNSFPLEFPVLSASIYSVEVRNNWRLSVSETRHWGVQESITGHWEHWGIG